MGLWRNQAARLLRERWSDANTLAEELYAMFTSDAPVEIDSPLVVTASPGQQAPPIVVRNFGQNDAGVQIQRRVPDQLDFPEIPPLPTLETGDFTVTNYYSDQAPEVFQNPAPGGVQPGGGSPIQSGGGGGTPGVVLSGTGDSYQVNIYPNGLAASPTEVTVTQLQIDPSAEIPAGTWALVTTAGGAYYMAVPVWQEDLA